ncbi:hypothetical protein BTUL_0003g00200 [Botrytis tulipae]|uniref:Uncharacterized protein n=1 Tax=Botrytis tulipae TaxID=87230 RepID=A0A4Z1FDC3_9HELO|nr:hypothetical protein BTUL_0003g00200 [Botrytis tulipae]
MSEDNFQSPKSPRSKPSSLEFLFQDLDVIIAITLISSSRLNISILITIFLTLVKQNTASSCGMPMQRNRYSRSPKFDLQECKMQVLEEITTRTPSRNLT